MATATQTVIFAPNPCAPCRGFVRAEGRWVNVGPTHRACERAWPEWYMPGAGEPGHGDRVWVRCPCDCYS